MHRWNHNFSDLATPIRVKQTWQINKCNQEPPPHQASYLLFSLPLFLKKYAFKEHREKFEDQNSWLVRPSKPISARPKPSFGSK